MQLNLSHLLYLYNPLFRANPPHVIEEGPLEVFLYPKATANFPLAILPNPIATAFSPLVVVTVPVPIEKELIPDLAPSPNAKELFPIAL